MGPNENETYFFGYLTLKSLFFTLLTFDLLLICTISVLLGSKLFVGEDVYAEEDKMMATIISYQMLIILITVEVSFRRKFFLISLNFRCPR